MASVLLKDHMYWEEGQKGRNKVSGIAVVCWIFQSVPSLDENDFCWCKCSIVDLLQGTGFVFLYWLQLNSTAGYQYNLLAEKKWNILKYR